MAENWASRLYPLTGEIMDRADERCELMEMVWLKRQGVYEKRQKILFDMLSRFYTEEQLEKIREEYRLKEKMIEENPDGPWDVTPFLNKGGRDDEH